MTYLQVLIAFDDIHNTRLVDTISALLNRRVGENNRLTASHFENMLRIQVSNLHSIHRKGLAACNVTWRIISLGLEMTDISHFN